VAGACLEESVPTESVPSAAFAIESLEMEAFLQELATTTRATGERTFAEIAQEVPEFGGYFFEGATLVALSVDDFAATAVRSAIQSRSNAIRSDLVGEQAFGPIDVRRADYSYRELWRSGETEQRRFSSQFPVR